MYNFGQPGASTGIWRAKFRKFSEFFEKISIWRGIGYNGREHPKNHGIYPQTPIYKIVMNSLKKTLTLAAVSSLFGAGSALAVDFSINTTFAYESEYVFRGIQLANDSFQPAVEAAIDSAYIGIWANLPIDDPTGAAGTEIDFYGGYGIDLYEGISLDVGATVYYYPEIDDSTFEAYVGFSFDVLLEPGVYLYWDFDLDTFTIEASASYSYDLADAGFDKASLDLSAYLGSVSPDVGDSYVYVGGTVDLSYAFSDNASGAIGLRISNNDVGFGVRDSNFWVGISFSAGF